jgi:taurine dioxygenase
LPTKITILKSVIRPNECGDTIFANTHAAYDGLDAAMKDQLRGLQGNYCYLKLRDLDNEGKTENLPPDEVKAASGCAIHPLITVHPITGFHNIYANPSHTASVVGMAPAESEALLQKLFAHTADPAYAYRHVYADDDLIMWDNRGTTFNS